MNSKVLNVLLVEDSPADVFIAREALRDTLMPVRLHVLNDGHQAVKYLTNQAPYTDAEKPDVVLLDLNMPKLNGHQVLQEIRLVRGMHDIPVVLLTASDNYEDVEKAQNRGMNFYLRKPVEARCLKELLNVIRNVWQPAMSQ